MIRYALLTQVERYWVGRMVFIFLLLLKEIFERRSCVLHDHALSRIAFSHFIRRKEVAKVRPLAVGNPLCLRLAATIVRRRIIVGAVQAAMDIRPALRTFFRPGNVPGFKLYLHAAMMTDH
jgi:hypothetical protein